MANACSRIKFCNRHQAAPFASLWETSVETVYKSDWVFSKHTSEACKASGSDVMSLIPRPDNAAVQSNISAIPGFFLGLLYGYFEQMILFVVPNLSLVLENALSK